MMRRAHLGVGCVLLLAVMRLVAQNAPAARSFSAEEMLNLVTFAWYKYLRSNPSAAATAASP